MGSELSPVGKLSEASSAWARLCSRYIRENRELLARVEAAEAALAAMPRPEDRCHGEWPCEASTYAASLEAELQQAQADARLILAAFVGANAEGVIEYRMTDADRDAIDVLIGTVYDTLEDSLLVATIRRVASIPDNPQETSETAGSVTE
jgi:hypothetical protein